MVSGKQKDIRIFYAAREQNFRFPLDNRMKCAICHAVLGNTGGMHVCRGKGKVIRSVFFDPILRGERYA